jgi:hypothetical protein
MAGTVEKAQSYFLRAGSGDEWELWSFPDKKRAHFIRQIAKPSEVPGETVVSLPAQTTISYPSWLATADRTLIPEIINLQLEQRGLIGRNHGGRSMDYRVVEEGESQTLAVATVLQPDFPEELAFERALRFEPSALTLPLPPDRITIWREKGRLVVCVTRGKEPIIFQVLSDRELSDAVALELKCIILQLEAQRLCRQFQGVTLWGEFSALEIDRLQTTLELTVTSEELPPPILPAHHFKLLPEKVAILHAKKRRRGQIRGLIIGVAALYALVLAGLIAYIGWESHKVDAINNKLKGQTSTVSEIQETADRWQRVEWAVNPKLFPVELLYQAAGSLPPDGLRLTGFELQKGKVLIEGEASTAPGAFKFAEDIKANPAMQMFNWQMPSPTLRPDGRAEFTVEGDPKIAKID